jgi:putative membrane protein
MSGDLLNLDFLTPEILRQELLAFWTGIPVTLLHAGTTLLMLFFGSALYAFLTPYKEIDQIKNGNSAASVAFGGVIIGLAIPLAAAMSASTSLRQIVIWGAATVLLQLFVSRLVDFVLSGLPDRVKEGEVSAAVLLVSAKLAVSLILAAAVSG